MQWTGWEWTKDTYYHYWGYNLANVTARDTILLLPLLLAMLLTFGLGVRFIFEISCTIED